MKIPKIFWGGGVSLHVSLPREGEQASGLDFLKSIWFHLLAFIEEDIS